MADDSDTLRAARSRAHAPDVLAALALAAAALLVWYLRLYRPAEIPFSILMNGDFYTQIYPMWVRIAESWRAGMVPLWNPYQYAGHPLLACSLYGVFYPPSLVYWLLPAGVAIEVWIVLHLVVAGVSAYAYARTIGLGRTATLVAAAGFMLSSFVLSQAAWFPPALASAVWLPLALLGVERLFRRADFFSALLLAVAMTLPFLGGWPQSWMYAMYVVGVYGLGRLVVAARSAEERRHLLRACVLGGAAAFVAAAWIAPQLLPSLELQGLGPRRTGALSDRRMMPLGWGTNTPRGLLAVMMESRAALPREGYVGIGALLLVPLSLLAAGQRWRVTCLGLVGAFSAAVAVSTEGPLFELYKLIGGSRFRFPTRFLYVFGAVAAILAAIGFDVVARLAAVPSGLPRAGAPRRVLVAVALVALAIGGTVLVPMLVPMPALSRFYFLATAALACGALLAPWRLARGGCVLLLAAMLIGDLVYAARNPFLHPAQRPHAFDAQGPAFEFIRARQGLERTYIKYPVDEPAFMSKQGSLRGIYSITDYEPLSLSRYEVFYRALESPRDRRPEDLTFTGRLNADPAWPQFHLIDLLSVRFFVFPSSDLRTEKGLARLAPKWRRVLATREGALVYENTDPLPRAYLAQHAIAAPSEEQALDVMTRPGFDPRLSVVIEPEDAPPPSAAPAPIEPARIVRYGATRVEVEVDAAAGGWLVLTDTHYPGWQATVDGEPAPIRRANFLFRGVWVGPGAHRVEFRYRPRSFQLGAAAALGGLALAAGAAGFELRRRLR